jgi:hypothetical protein
VSWGLLYSVRHCCSCRLCLGGKGRGQDGGRREGARWREGGEGQDGGRGGGRGKMGVRGRGWIKVG